MSLLACDSELAWSGFSFSKQACRRPYRREYLGGAADVLRRTGRLKMIQIL